MRVRGHKRNGRNVRPHMRKTAGGVTFKGDKWPPPFGKSKPELLAYEQRLRTEIGKFASGALHVIPGHAGHPAFIHKRLKQVITLLRRSN